ncbi:uncharacterized protein ACR2FA_011978 [Aphomia sociella]
MAYKKRYLFKFVLVVLLAVSLRPSHTATVNPARCPTNKIAPHRRIPNWTYYNRARTFGGAFVDLLTPDVLNNNLQNESQNDLQEKPQEDDMDDCGEIEDYDETDIGSLTSQNQRRNSREQNRFFLGLFQNRPQQQRPPSSDTTSISTTYRPQYQTTQNTYPYTRPPWSGGFFESNYYQPPQAQQPSDSVKPVHEYADTPINYWPGIIGGVATNIEPASPARPTVSTTIETATSSPSVRFPQYSAQVTRRPRNRLEEFTVI